MKLTRPEETSASLIEKIAPRISVLKVVQPCLCSSLSDSPLPQGIEFVSSFIANPSDTGAFSV